LGYSENYTKVTPGYIQLLNGTFNTTISADGTLNGSPILTEGAANSMYYSASNPNGYINASSLAPYLTTSIASSTYFTIANAANKANLASPTFTGVPAAPTPAATSNTTQISTTAFVQTNNNVKAWVNFNGTGTVAIRSSKNVTSITDNGTGDYTVNFTTAMADSNYLVNATGSIPIPGGASGIHISEATTTTSSFARTTSSIRVWSLNFQGGNTDAFSVNVAILR